MRRIAVCDDDNKHLKHIEDIAKEFFSQIGVYKLDTFGNGTMLLEAMKKENFDIVLLDIIMPELSGMVTAEKIREFNSHCIIIFVTSSPDFAIEGYSVKAFDYILKPAIKENVFESLRKACLSLSKDEAYIQLIVNKCTIRVKVSEIVFIESAKHWLFFHMLDGTDLKVYEKLDTYDTYLSTFLNFMRCHKSFLVNMDYIEAVVERCFVTKNGGIIPIRKANATALKKMYYSYILNKKT